MNWQSTAIEDLKNYKNRKQSLENIPLKVSALEQRLQSLKGTVTDKVPVQGGSSRIEDNMLDNIVERERLKHTYRATKKLVDLVDKGLSGLSDQERTVLDIFFINKRSGHLEQLMNMLHAEKSTVYRIKDAALYKFTVSMYGIIDY